MFALYIVLPCVARPRAEQYPVFGQNVEYLEQLGLSIPSGEVSVESSLHSAPADPTMAPILNTGPRGCCGGPTGCSGQVRGF